MPADYQRAQLLPRRDGDQGGVPGDEAAGPDHGLGGGRAQADLPGGRSPCEGSHQSRKNCKLMENPYFEIMNFWIFCIY